MKRLKLKRLSGQIIVLSFLFFIGCSAPIEKIVIISTNDVHGELNAFARLATLVDDVRAADTAAVLLIDAGDRWTGNPYTDLAQEKGYPIIELMNTIGYDYSTLGNHEFDHGQGLLSQRIADGKFQNLIANLKVATSQFPQLPPYAIFTVGSLKIALIGVLHNYENGHPDGKPEIFNGLEFTDPIQSIASHRNLRDSADLFIALTHIGAKPDSVLAATVPELDLILGGHSHTVIPNGKKIGNTLITQTGKSLNYAGVTTITSRGGKILSIINGLVKLDTVALSPRYQHMIDGYNHNPELTKSIGAVADPMNKIQIMNMLTDVIRKDTKTDIAFYNLGGVRIDHLNKGDVSVADVFALEPFSSVMYTFEMKPDQIKTLLLNKFNSNGRASQAVDLYPSGVSYEFVRDPATGTGKDIIFRPALDPKKTYRVALSDYVGSAYIFDLQGKGTSTDVLLTDVMLNNFKKNSPLKNISAINRVVVPAVE